MTADRMTSGGLDGWVEDGAHHYLLRVQFEDTDAGGIVYHANYLAFAERARSAYLRCIDIRQEETMAAGAEDSIMFVVKAARHRLHAFGWAWRGIECRDKAAIASRRLDDPHSGGHQFRKWPHSCPTSRRHRVRCRRQGRGRTATADAQRGGRTTAGRHAARHRPRLNARRVRVTGRPVSRPGTG